MSSEQQQPGAEAPKQKSKEELEKEQQQAKEQLEALLSQSAPKNVQEGTLKGVNNILAGAVGAAGIAVLAPTVGMGAGLKNGGLIGGVFGLTGGAVVGVSERRAFYKKMRTPTDELFCHPPTRASQTYDFLFILSCLLTYLMLCLDLDILCSLWEELL